MERRRKTMQIKYRKKAGVRTHPQEVQGKIKAQEHMT
jgi:hypothetical protein